MRKNGDVSSLFEWRRWNSLSPATRHADTHSMPFRAHVQVLKRLKKETYDPESFSGAVLKGLGEKPPESFEQEQASLESYYNQLKRFRRVRAMKRETLSLRGKDNLVLVWERGRFKASFYLESRLAKIDAGKADPADGMIEW